MTGRRVDWWGFPVAGVGVALILCGLVVPGVLLVFVGVFLVGT